MLRKITIGVVALVVAALSSAVYAQSSRVKVNADEVSVRKGPSTSSSRITFVSKGASGTVVSRSGEWAKIKFDHGVTGYVRRDLLSSISTSSKSTTKQVSTASTKVRTSANNVIVRSKPTTSSSKVAMVAKDTVATVIEKTDTWAKVKFPGGTVGWIRRDLLTSAPSNGKPTYSVAGEKINYISTSLVKVNADNVTVRKSATTNSSKVTQVDSGTMATVIDRYGAWYKVRFQHGTVGYVRGDLLNAYTRTTGGSRTSSSQYYAMKATAPKLPISGNDVQIVAVAKEMLGTPYVWASESRNGVDCSGLAYFLYQKYEGITLPRTSREMVNYGEAVSKSNVSPGDLLFFHTRGSSRINHVGVYIGGGKFIHASSSRGQVVVSDCSGGYYQSRLAAIRRPKSSLKKVDGSRTGSSKSASKSATSKSRSKSAKSKK
jgi:cell wall-associated NlpC family hydrolase